MIELERIAKSFAGRAVVRDVSMRVEEGENVGLVGPGGVGKTLLLKIMCGLLAPDRGRVVVRGVKVDVAEEGELAQLRLQIGMLFQNYALFDFMNIFDNIAFPLRQAGETDEALIRDRVEAILEQVGLPGIGHQYARELSGGMKKRVSFARSVIRRPPIMLYDDPTAGLDPVTSAKIFDLLRAIRDERGVTSVTISHDLAGIAPICDRFVMLDEGRVVFRGQPDEALDAPNASVRSFWESGASLQIDRG